MVISRRLGPRGPIALAGLSTVAAPARRRPFLVRAPQLWLLGLITVAGLALRLPSFGDSLFGDELSAYFIVSGHSLGAMMHLLNNHSTELNPPLFFMLAWVSTKLFGLSAASLKLVSLLAGTAIIPLTYALGRRLVGTAAGLLAAAITALSPFLIYYSTEARPYALLVMLVLLSTLSLLKALGSGSWPWWLAYAVFACAAAYTHFTAIFPLAAQVVWALATAPRARRQVLLATAGAAIGYLPELPVLIRTTHSKGTSLYQELEPFSLHSIHVDLGHWALGHPYLTLAEVPGSWAAVLAAVAVIGGGLLALVTFVRRRRQGGAPPVSPGLILVIVLALSAPVLDALYSAVRESVWGARNVISSWPAFAVALAALLTYPRLPWRLPATVAVLIAFAAGGLAMVPQTYHRPDTADAIAYIDRVDPRAGPLVDVVAPTPGPPTATEAALGLAGTARLHPDFRLGLPPLKAVLAAPPYTTLPRQTGEQVAREAAAVAGRGHLFIVIPTAVPISALEATRRRHVHDNSGQLGLLASFLGELPARFHPQTSRTFTGLAPITVYVYRG